MHLVTNVPLIPLNSLLLTVTHYKDVQCSLIGKLAQIGTSTQEPPWLVWLQQGHYFPDKENARHFMTILGAVCNV